MGCMKKTFCEQSHCDHDCSYYYKQSITDTQRLDTTCTDWKVESEVYEVECEWDNSNGLSPIYPFDRALVNGFDWSQLLGKRTKLRIEVQP